MVAVAEAAFRLPTELNNIATATYGGLGSRQPTRLPLSCGSIIQRKWAGCNSRPVEGGVTFYDMKSTLCSLISSKAANIIVIRLVT